NPSKTQPPVNQSCHDQVQFGAHREPVQRSSTGAAKVMPRATATFGPFGHFNLSLSYGEGVRSIDPSYISQDLDTPFASVRAYEGGVTYANQVGPFTLTARSIFFETKVDRDLVFSQTEGRNVLANGTTRLGWAGALRLANAFFDDSANLTLVRPTFDDTHLEIPYVPTLVFREDAAVNQTLPWKIGQRAPKASLAVGWTYVGRRALPYNQVSDVISVVDASAALRLGGTELSLAVTNLFDVRYRLGEFYYASDFHSQPEPTLVPASHFTAGAPRGIFLSLSGTLGGAS
ncbi:MAG TPA: TonB-dependent receptor, partial [Polyangiaceae bacterium]|nr:TonB-dependent receptor [Polyangiaceae bacterium]